MTVRVREPSWIGATVEAPGEDVRCSPQERSAFGIPTHLEFSTEIPGLFGPASFTLPRPDWFAADEVRRWLYAPVRYFDEDNRTVYEGRVTNNSHVGASEIQIDCEGFAKSLEDREDARELIIDASLERWGEPSTQRKLDILAAQRLDIAQSTGWQDGGAAAPGVLFQVSELESGVRDLGEAWWFGEGVDLGAIRYDFATPTTPDPDWLDRVYLSSNDVFGSYDSGTDHNQTNATNQALIASSAGRKYAAIQTEYQGTYVGADNLYHNWLNVKLIGRHGLIERGTWPNIGFYLSDIVTYLVGRWGTLLRLTDRSIEPTSFAIPHVLWLQDTKPLDMIESLVLFGGNSLLPMDWGVGEGREFFCKSPGNYGRVWRTRLDEGTESTDAGDDAKARINGVKMTWQDGGGHSHNVGPPGSGADTETTALLDTRPENPVNFGKGVDKRYRSASMETTYEEGAILTGQVILADANRRRWSGDVELKGFIREQGGTEEPAYMVRACDRGVVEDEPDIAERRITATTYDSERRSVKATIGQDPQRTETLLARAGVVLEGRL
jgi:hypothetical protein